MVIKVVVGVGRVESGGWCELRRTQVKSKCEIEEWEDGRYIYDKSYKATIRPKSRFRAKVNAARNCTLK